MEFKNRTVGKKTKISLKDTPPSAALRRRDKNTFTVLVAGKHLAPLARVIYNTLKTTEERPVDIFICRDIQDALNTYYKETPDLIFADCRPSEAVDFKETFKTIRKAESEGKANYPYTKIIALADQTQIKSQTEYYAAGADSVLVSSTSPLEANEVFISIVGAERREAHARRAMAQKIEELEKEARVDILTGLRNRRYGEEHLEEMTSLCSRKKRPMMVCFCDLDRFKEVNDTWGHEAGDKVLKKIGDFLRRGIRISDSAVRWGGDEFLLLFPETGGNEALIILNRLRESMKDFTVDIGINGEATLVLAGISIGCAWGYPPAGAKWEDIVACADSLLYEAKEDRRNSDGNLLTFVSRQVPGWDAPESQMDILRMRNEKIISGNGISL